MGKKKLTKTDLEALEQARRNTAWLRELAEKAYSDLESSGKLTVRRPEGPFPTPTPAEIKAARERARANTALLRELAEKAKADLDRRNEQSA